jgi:CelD/BcsL family acetyltransferase involved in cellulose biosynthesis
MITVKIEHDKSRIAEHVKRWNEIFDSGDFEASTSLEWSQALLTSHVKEDGYRLLVVCDSNRIVGYVPLVLGKTRKYGFSIRWMHPLSEYYSTHSDLLLQNINDEIAGAVVSALYSLKDKWDVFRMNEIAETNPILAPIENYLKKRSISYSIRTEEPIFYIRLNGTFQDYLKKRDGKFRYNLRRREKRIIEKGHMEYSKYHGQNEWEEGYEQLLHVDQHSWKQGHGTAITLNEKQKLFYRSICQQASEAGHLRISILRLNREPIAYMLGFIKGRRYFSLKTSYVERYRTFSPGTVLHARVIEDLFREEFEEFDFAGEPYEWESQWTDDARWHKSLFIYNRTAMAKIYSHVRDIKHQKNDKTIHYRDPKNVMPEE